MVKLRQGDFMAKRKASSPGEVFRKYIADFGQTPENLAAAI
jgi:hypothetical protein